MRTWTSFAFAIAQYIQINNDDIKYHLIYDLSGIWKGKGWKLRQIYCANLVIFCYKESENFAIGSQNYCLFWANR